MALSKCEQHTVCPVCREHRRNDLDRAWLSIEHLGISHARTGRGLRHGHSRSEAKRGSTEEDGQHDERGREVAEG